MKLINVIALKSITKDNFRSNAQKLGIIIPVLVVGLLIVVLSKFDTIFIILAIFISITLIGVILYFYKNGGHQIIFNENDIIIKAEMNNSETVFAYTDLLSIKHTTFKGGSFVTLSFNRNNELIKKHFDNNSSHVEFVKFVVMLKQKNKNLKTYIYPKGSKLHSTLRKEILGLEY